MIFNFQFFHFLKQFDPNSYRSPWPQKFKCYSWKKSQKRYYKISSGSSI